MSATITLKWSKPGGNHTVRKALRILPLLLLVLTSLALAGDKTAWSDSVFTQSLREPELSLQDLLDGLGYNINVSTDAISLSTFTPPSGKERAVVTLEHYGQSSDNPVGWYPYGSSGSTNQLFDENSLIGTEVVQMLAPGQEIGLYLGPTLYGDTWYSESSLNWDLFEHIKVFATETPDEYVIAWEDLPDGGDQDFNDAVISLRFTNPDALSLEFVGETFFLLCTEDFLCFDVNVSGGTGDLTLYQIVEGTPTEVASAPGPYTYEHCWLPWPEDSIHTFTFRVEDEANETVEDDFSIEIKMNSRPVLTVDPTDIDTMLCGLAEICFDVVDATDEDLDEITFNLLEGPGTINPLTGEICFTPDDLDSADYMFVVEASDSCCASFGELIAPTGCPRDTINVTVHLQPETILTTINDTTITLCDPEPVCFAVTAMTGEDPTPVYQECGPGSLTGGELCFTPAGSGQYQFCFYATGPCGSDYDTVNVEIIINQPPTADAGPDQELGCVSGEICWPAGCSDPDGDLESCELISGPGAYDGSQICFEPTGSGTYEFVLRAADSCGFDLDTVVITVESGNPPLAHVTDFTGELCDPQSVCIDAWCEDPDDDLVSCELVEAPSGATYDGSQICYTPADDGTYEFILKALDECGNVDYDTGYITVEINTGPQVNPGGGSFVLCEPDSICVPVNVFDPDGDHTISTTMGHIDGDLVCIWSGTEEGTHQFTFEVSADDTCGHHASAQFVIDLRLNMIPELELPTLDPETICAGEELCFDVDALDTVITQLIFSLLDGPGTIDETTGEVCFTPTVAGTESWQVVVEDSCGAADTATVEWQIDLLPPPEAVILPPDGLEEICYGDPVNEIMVDFTYENSGMVDMITVTPDNGSIDWSVDYGGGTGQLRFTPEQDVNADYGFTFTLQDICGATAEAVYTHTVNFIDCDSTDCLTIKIDESDCVNLSSIVTVNITISEDLIPIGGYDLLINYDQSALSVLGAQIGPDVSGWEYFTYSLDPLGSCSSCPTGMLRLIAIADVNNGGNHPPVEQFTANGSVAQISFRVTSNTNFGGYVIPISFYWFDCGDNGISTVSGDTLLVDKIIFDPERLIWDEEDDINYPELDRIDGLGVPDTCVEGDKTEPLRCVTFINGSVCIIHNDSIDARGDINLNGLANEIGDAVLFTNYFLKGISVFTISVAGQTVATDINADGVALQLGDLIYLLRIITGDALPIPKLAPYHQEVDLELAADSYGTTFSSVSNTELGGVFLKIKLDPGAVAEIVPTEELAELGFDYEQHGDVLNLLIYSDQRDARIDSGRRELFSLRGVTSAEVVHAEASDYFGSDIGVRVAKTTLPTGFELHQNFPNPFNPETQISLALPQTTDWTLTIFNINGQMVRTFEGTAAAGVTTVTWDGRDLNGQQVATGVYLYKMVAGDFSDTKKMLLVK